MTTQLPTSNEVISALKGAFDDVKTLRKHKFIVYKGWEASGYVRGRVNFYTDDEKIISYFLHMNDQELKIWAPGTGKNDPPMTISLRSKS